jgi:hypothetical protein
MCAVLLQVRPDAQLAFVHWWYFPDSYDQWIPLADVDPKVEEDPDPHARQYVCCRFIKDVAIFNEWMNEVDYEIESGGDDDELMEGKDQEKDKKKKRKKDK